MMSKLQLRDQLLLERAKQLGILEPSDAEVRAELRAEVQRAIAALEPITLDDLTEAAAEFEKVEPRGGFYDLARGLVEKGFALEGCILILATWNAGRFSKVHFKIDDLRNALAELRDDFAALAGYTIQTVQLESHRNRIEAMFNRLAKIKGVEYTGAPKVMHLMLPELFVAWDAYIRGRSDKEDRLYAGLPCVDSKKWCLVRYDQNGSGYVDFLLNMQSRVRDLVYSTSGKTLAKILDEWNYVRITIPIQAIEKAEEKRRKEEKRARRKAR
jgi:hypothetical protein